MSRRVSNASQRAISLRHQKSYERPGGPDTGSVRYHRFLSESLQIEKAFHVYLPPSYHNDGANYPSIYLFRGSEREWVNPLEDGSRGGATVANVMDHLIATGAIGPTLLIMPSTVSERETPCLGVAMVEPADEPGAGTGRYDRYLTEDLINEVERLYAIRSDRHQRAVDGFSLGGYTSVLLGIKHPERFGSVGSYDGTFMWADLIDPRDGKNGRDATWLDPAFFDAAFGQPRQQKIMLEHNASNLLRKGDDPTIQLWREMSWMIRAGGHERVGNVDRAYHLVGELNRLGIVSQGCPIELDPAATHTWRWADEHLRHSAVMHWSHFNRHNVPVSS